MSKENTIVIVHAYEALFSFSFLIRKSTFKASKPVYFLLKE